MSKVPVTYRHVLASCPGFWNLWVAEIFSVGGDWFNLVATATLISTFSDSGLAIGGLFVARMLPSALLSPVAGLLADLVNRKLILIVSDVFRAVTTFSFLLVDDAGDAWLLYALTFFQLALSSFATPARNAILPDLVPEAWLGAANALSSLTFGTMYALGTALGGLVSGSLGPGSAFILCTLSYLAAVAFLAGIKHGREAQGQVQRKKALINKKSYLRPLKYIFATRERLLLTLHKGLNALFITGGLNVLIVVLAQDIFSEESGAAIGIGLAFFVTAVGSAIGPVVGRAVFGDDKIAYRRNLVRCYVISAAGLAMAASPGGFSVILVGLLIRGIGGGMMWMSSTQLLMADVVRSIQGRVFSYEHAARTSLNIAGTVIVSFVLDLGVGPQTVLLVMAVLAPIPGVIWAFAGSRRRRRL